MSMRRGSRMDDFLHELRYWGNREREKAATPVTPPAADQRAALERAATAAGFVLVDRAAWETLQRELELLRAWERANVPAEDTAS